MEELLLRPLLVRQLIDVVDDEEVHVAVPVPEVLQVPPLDGGDEMVGEGFAAQVEYADVGEPRDNLVGDGLHEVRLAQAHGSMDEEGVEGVSRGFHHGLRRRLGQAVRRADDEVLEGVIGIERDVFHDAPVEKKWTMTSGQRRAILSALIPLSTAIPNR